MPRTRSKHYPDNKALILDQAALLFAEKGFPRTSVMELAKACQFSKAWLYHYFPSKEDILFHLLIGHMQTLLQITEQAIAGHENARDQFRAVVRDNLEKYIAQPEKHVVLMNDLACLPPPAQQQVRDVERRLVNTVTALLLRLRPDLRDRPALQKPVTMMFYGLINWTYVWYDSTGPLSQQGLATLAIDLFLDGLDRMSLEA